MNSILSSTITNVTEVAMKRRNCIAEMERIYLIDVPKEVGVSERADWSHKRWSGPKMIAVRHLVMCIERDFAR